jgi:elongator complex protein 3
VYGQTVGVGSETNSLQTQHKGFGQLLLSTAEQIIKSHSLTKSAVIAGIGAREYYRTKCGYKLEGTYMTKNLN